MGGLKRQTWRAQRRVSCSGPGGCPAGRGGAGVAGWSRATSLCPRAYLVLLLAAEAQAGRPLLEALAVVRPRLVGLELHPRAGLLQPLLRPPPWGPGRRHPAGESGRRKSRCSGAGGTGGGGGADTDGEARRPPRHGTERGSLQSGRSGGSAASAPAPAALHGARRRSQPLLACTRRRRLRRRRGKSAARGSCHAETVGSGGADRAETPRMRAAPFARI